jgi:hypothetical protein
MPIIRASGFAVTVTADVNADNPVILWDSLVTITNVEADTEEAENPATNLANPSTSALWRANDAAGQDIVVTLAGETIDGVGIARHNLGTAAIPLRLEYWDGTDDTTVQLLLHFDGADAATTFTDSSTLAHTMTAVGNAQLDTAKAKFGRASLLLDGTGDYVTTPDSAVWGPGTGAFTFDFWAWPNALSGTHTFFTHYTDANNYYRFTTSSAGALTFAVVVASVTTVTMTSAAGAIVTGAWHHLAVVRTGNVWTIYVNGVSVATTTDADSMPNFTQTFRIGADGAAANGFNGWIDEFRFSNAARWTAAFTPPTAAAPYTVLIPTFTPDDDTPILFQFTAVAADAVRVCLGIGTAAAEMAVLFVGSLLTLQRRLYVGHTPLPLARRQEVTTGRSQSGEHLGSVITGEWYGGSVAQQNLTASWYRTYMAPFIENAPEPFFFAWRPNSYPDEIAFAWCTGDPIPSNARSNGMMSIEFDVEAIP